MPDEYPYYTPEAIETATEGIRAEAKKWFGFANEMTTIATNMGSLTLGRSAFAVIDVSGVLTATDQQGAYQKTQEWLTALFRDGAAKMDRFDDALNKCADEYDRTDGQSAKSFDKIAKS